jgi:hypothetical protein
MAEELKSQLQRRKYILAKKRQDATNKADVQMTQTALATFDSVLAIFEQYGDEDTRAIVIAVRNL